MLQQKTGLKRFYKYRDQWREVLDKLADAPAEEQNPIMMGIIHLLIAQDETIIDCVENDKIFLSSWYANAPEIYSAMDIPHVSPVDNILQHLYDNHLQDLEDCDRMGIPEDICTLLRLSAYSVKAGIIPTPSAIIGLMQPCDGMSALHESYHNSEEWGDVPFFGLDGVHGSTDDDFTYFAGELRRMISFLEELSGRNMDFEKLRNVIEETNRQYEQWSEYNELRRAIPCPAPAFQSAMVFFTLTGNIRSGQPEATELMRMLVAHTETLVKEKKGFVANEKIRIFWADNGCVWGEEIATWLAEEWNANIIMDWQSYDPFTAIDTSSEESMLKGLARRHLTEVMMLRQGLPVEVILEDMTRIIRDYGIDCVIYPGHMGHKDQAGYIGFMRDLCRDMEVPFMSFTSSMFDPRYTSMDKIKKQISEFFTVNELGDS